MELTPGQLTSIKAFVAGDGPLNALAGSTDGGTLATIANALNAFAAPDFIVWRTNIPSIEIVSAITGSEFAALTAIKQNLLTLMIAPGVVDGSKPTIQANFSAIFSAGASLTALAATAKRKATVIEKILATGTGSTASPATMAVEGLITPQQVDAARRS